jgi:hypothetical protein
MDLKNNKYLTLTIIFVILSVVGIILLFQIIKNKSLPTNETTNVIPTVTLVPTIAPKIQMLPEATASSKTASSSSVSAKKITVTPTASPTAKLTPTPTASPTAKLTPTPKTTVAPTVAPVSKTSSTIQTFTNQSDSFSISYKSTRTEYSDKESSGNRYTFINSSGNFAVHVGLNNKWAWINSDRSFTSDLLVSGQNTFRYDISTQTIVDLQSSDKNYTIQCIHNGNATLKAECEDFIKSFKLL